MEKISSILNTITWNNYDLTMFILDVLTDLFTASTLQSISFLELVLLPGVI